MRGDRLAPANPEAQLSARPSPRVRDPNAGTPGDGFLGAAFGSGEKERRAVERMAVVAPSDSQRCREAAGARGAAGAQAFHWLQRPNEHGFPGSCHDIEAVVHSVDEKDVGVAGRAEHHFRSRRTALGAVAGEIAWPQIGFGLDDAADAARVLSLHNQQLAEEVAGDVDGISSSERSRQYLQSSRLHHLLRGRAFFEVSVPFRVGFFLTTKGISECVPSMASKATAAPLSV